MKKMLIMVVMGLGLLLACYPAMGTTIINVSDSYGYNEDIIGETFSWQELDENGMWYVGEMTFPVYLNEVPDNAIFSIITGGVGKGYIPNVYLNNILLGPLTYSNGDDTAPNTYQMDQFTLTDAVIATLSLTNVIRINADPGDGWTQAGTRFLSEFVVNDDPTDPNIQPVPEPTTLLMLGCGLLGLAGFARRKAM